MAGRVKIKQKELIDSTVKNKNVMNLFHEIIGSKGNINFSIVWPKFKKIKQSVYEYISTLSVLEKASVMQNFEEDKKMLELFVQKLWAAYEGYFKYPEIEKYEVDGQVNFNLVPQYVLEKFSQLYRSRINSELVTLILNSCAFLSKYNDYILKKDPYILTITPGLCFSPIPNFEDLNFKYLYNSDKNSQHDKDFIMFILYKLYTAALGVYNAISIPDIDVEDLENIILSSVSQIKKQIPRCKDAFNKIESSVHLLRKNFNTYYSDYVGSGYNPTIIMEQYIKDISQDSKNISPRISYQFRTIIKYYRDMIATKHQTMDPQVLNLVKHVEKKLDMLDREKN
ncbi:pH339R [African swine fever virus]|nr:pH339R (j4R) [African swine fever virus]